MELQKIKPLEEWSSSKRVHKLTSLQNKDHEKGRSPCKLIWLTDLCLKWQVQLLLSLYAKKLTKHAKNLLLHKIYLHLYGNNAYKGSYRQQEVGRLFMKNPLCIQKRRIIIFSYSWKSLSIFIDVVYGKSLSPTWLKQKVVAKDGKWTWIFPRKLSFISLPFEILSSIIYVLCDI